MNPAHEKAIEEALNHILKSFRHRLDPINRIPLRDRLRALVATILRTESQRVDTRPSYTTETAAFWSKSLPAVSGLWWWWNEDEDSLPLVVDIAYSGTGDNYFAMQGQHGWNRFQPVEEMGGYWMRCYEPLLPTESQQKGGGVPSEGVPPAIICAKCGGTLNVCNQRRCYGIVNGDFTPQPVEPAAEKIGEQQSTLSVKDLLALDAEIHSLLASLAQQQSDSFSQSGLKVSQVQMLAALIRSFGKVEPAASETPETTSELAREIKSIRGLTEIDHTQQVEAVIQSALDAQAAQYQSQLTDLRDRVQKLENALNGLRNAWSHPHEEINTFIDKALKP